MIGHGKRVRVVKREQAGREAQAVAAPNKPAAAINPVREVKEVVSGWVREHQRRSEEFRRNYSSLLNDLGLTTPRGGGHALVNATPLLNACK